MFYLGLCWTQYSYSEAYNDCVKQKAKEKKEK